MQGGCSVLGDLIAIKNLLVTSDDAELHVEVQYVVQRTQSPSAKLSTGALRNDEPYLR